MNASLRAAVGCVVGMLTANAAFAQRSDETAQLESVEEVIVTGTRSEKSVDKIPGAINVISPAEVERTLTLTPDPTAVLARTVPGYSESSQTMNTLGETLRGRVPLRLLDGIPQSTTSPTSSISCRSRKSTSSAIISRGAGGPYRSRTASISEADRFGTDARYSNISPSQCVYMSQPRAAILVAGSANVDFVLRAAHVPAPGETVLGRELAIFPGGKGANQAVACARAGGAHTAMVLALGRDTFAPIVEESLRSAGVELHVVRCEEPTGAALICLADDAQNAITVAPGANARLRGSDLPALAGVKSLLLQLETPLPTVIEFARHARAQGVQVVLNAAPARELPSELMELLDVLIVNEEELGKLAGRRGSVRELLEAVAVPCAVVTLGERGCCARARDEFFLQPAFSIEAVDTTAAGDTFCGAFAAALCADSPLPQALRRASAAAALATTRLGAQSSIPTIEAVDALLRTHTDAHSDAHAALAAYCAVAPTRSAT